MSTFSVQIRETYTYQALIDADTAEDAMRIASEILEDADNAGSAFGSPDYGDVYVESARALRDQSEGR